MPELVKEDALKEFIAKLPAIDYGGAPEPVTPEKQRKLLKQGKNPPLTPPTGHLAMLGVRSRFAKLRFGVKIKDLMVERKVIRPYPDWRETLFGRIYNLATLQEHGHYTFTKQDGERFRITPECFGIYATIIPRHINSAVGNLLHDTINQTMSNDVDGRRRYYTKIDTKFFGRLRANKYNKTFKAITLDIDDPAVYPAVRDMISPFDVWMITKTSRGYHIILDMRNRATAIEFYVPKGAWDQICKTFRVGKPTPAKGKKGKKGKPPTEEFIPQVELKRDPQEPIPGTRYYRSGAPENYVEIIE